MTTENSSVPAVAWYQSHVFVSGVISIVSQAFVMLNIKVAPGVIDSNVNAILTVVGLIAAAYSAWKRYHSTVQPLTVTKGSADAKNNPPTPTDRGPAGSDGLS